MLNTKTKPTPETAQISEAEKVEQLNVSSHGNHICKMGMKATYFTEMS